MKMLVLTEKDIKEVLTMGEAIDAAKKALAIYSKGGANIPVRTNVQIEGANQSLYMPGYVKEAEASGIKIVSVYPGNASKGITGVPATMLLLDEKNGMVNCLMDGTFLTKLRTGAVSGAATELLAKKDAKIMAIFGAGGQAEAQIEAVLQVRKIEQLNICDLDKSKAEAFAKKMTERFGIKTWAAESSKEAVKDADIITTVTTAKEPVLDGRDIKQGVHINAVGSYTPEMSEIDQYTVCHADKIYFDTMEGVLEESGDIIKPINDGTFRQDKVTGELGHLLLQQIAGRESSEEITLFETVGSAVLDLVTAKIIYDKAKAAKVGDMINL